MNQQFLVPEWQNQTTLHPLGLAAVLILGMSMLLAPRSYVVVPMIVMACFVAPAQRVVVFTLDFNLLRILVLFGWVRVLLQHEFRGLRWKSIDIVIILWGISGLVIQVLQHGSIDVFIYRLGVMFDAVGMYFLFRCLIRNPEDVARIITWICVISVPVAAAFLIEHATARNMFSIFGGVPEITTLREGRLRCQGAFAHPILAGCFWASFMPLMASGWWGSTRRRVLAAVGLGSSLVIIYACASSTPVAAVILALGAACLFPLRRWMSWIRWGGLGLLVVLHLVMKAPVWHLISRIDLVGGSTGWHRYIIIDQTIEHFDEWWLLGTTSTAQWGWRLFSLTNEFTIEAVGGGLLTLLLFVGIFALGFSAVGRLWRTYSPDRWRVALAWGLGAALFVHVASCMGAAYVGQIFLAWYLLLAMIASLDSGRLMQGTSQAFLAKVPPTPYRDKVALERSGSLPAIWSSRPDIR